MNLKVFMLNSFNFLNSDFHLINLILLWVNRKIFVENSLVVINRVDFILHLLVLYILHSEDVLVISLELLACVTGS